MLHQVNDATLYTPKDAVLPSLHSMERSLAKVLKHAKVYCQEIKKLQRQATYYWCHQRLLNNLSSPRLYPTIWCITMERIGLCLTVYSSRKDSGSMTFSSLDQTWDQTWDHAWSVSSLDSVNMPSLWVVISKACSIRSASYQLTNRCYTSSCRTSIEL